MKRIGHLEILVEEPSMEAFLRGLMPRLAGPQTTYAIHPFSSKNELLKRLPGRLRGYSQWIPGEFCLVVLVDRDRDDCVTLKRRIERLAMAAGLETLTRARARDVTPQVAIRIVEEELEAWYFGDWPAVQAAYSRIRSRPPECRSPDDVANGTWEAFERTLQEHRYHLTGLRKIEAARKISAHVDPNRSTSPSFLAFRDAIRELTS